MPGVDFDRLTVPGLGLRHTLKEAKRTEVLQAWQECLPVPKIPSDGFVGASARSRLISLDNVGLR